MGIYDSVRREADQQRRLQEFAEPINRILEHERAARKALEIPQIDLMGPAVEAERSMRKMIEASEGLLEQHRLMKDVASLAQEHIGPAVEAERSMRQMIEAQEAFLDHQRRIEEAARPIMDLMGRATEAEDALRRSLEPPQAALKHLLQIQEAVLPMKAVIDAATARAIEPIRSAAEQVVTIQQAANRLLQESQQALSARELAASALDRQLVYSSARDPINSLAQTLEKNVREEVYNNPPLKFVHQGGKRLLALPEWVVEPKAESAPRDMTRFTMDVSPALARDLQLAVQAGLADTSEEAFVLFAKRGLSAASAEIKEAIMSKLEQFGEDDDTLV